MKWMRGTVFCDAIQALRQQLNGIHSLKPYLKTYLHNCYPSGKGFLFFLGVNAPFLGFNNPSFIDKSLLNE